MTWLNRIEGDLIITTGDGKVFSLKKNSLKWKPTAKSIEYNVSEFEFPDIEGTKVDRRTVKGTRHEFEIYFDGENHLDNALSFEISARDKRAWTITHPYHGNITVHPISLTFDYRDYNVTVITGTIVETITEENPKAKIDPVDKITEDKTTTDDNLASSFENGNPTPDAKDIGEMTTNTSNIYNKGKNLTPLENSEEYFNLFNTANSKITEATSAPLAAIRAIQAMISYPGQFATSVKNRIDILLSQLGILRDAIPGIISSNRKTSKILYENNAGTLLSTMALTTATPESDTDYANSQDVLNIISDLLDSYDNYLTDIDSLQSENGGEIESYIPDQQSQIALNDLIHFTVSNLFNIAINAKQERSIFLEDDSNLIVLAHRFYGLLPDDTTLDEFIRNNSIGLNEYLQIKKGRKIIYFV